MEYALVALLVGIAAITAMQLVGGSINDMFIFASDALEKASGGS